MNIRHYTTGIFPIYSGDGSVSCSSTERIENFSVNLGYENILNSLIKMNTLSVKFNLFRHKKPAAQK